MTTFCDQLKLEKNIKRYELVLVIFYASWCKPCQKITAILNELQFVKSNQIKVIAVNIDDNGSVALAHKVTVIPTINYYKNGALFLKESGLQTAEHLCQNIETLVAIQEVIV